MMEYLAPAMWPIGLILIAIGICAVALVTGKAYRALLRMFRS